MKRCCVDTAASVREDYEKRVKELEAENEAIKEENFDHCAKIKVLESAMQEFINNSIGIKNSLACHRLVLISRDKFKELLK